MIRRVSTIGVLTLTLLFGTVALTAPAVAVSAPHISPPAPQVIYDSTTSPLPPNMVSEAFEATGTSEFGNLVQFAPGTARDVSQATVTLSSWGCQSGSWSGGNCVTTPGSSFAEPITFSIYNVGASNTVGTLIAQKTQTFAIPYRPTSTPALCGGDTGAWADPTTDACYHGLDYNAVFTLANVVVPGSVIYGVSFNTSDYGNPPYGDATACHATAEGCGYDSLNVALTEAAAPSVGTDPTPGTVFQNPSNDYFWCDNGAAGTGVFRMDALDGSGNCANPDGGWSVNGPTPNTAPWYIPAVQFQAAVSSPASFASSAVVAYAARRVHFSTTVTATGNPTPTVTLVSGSVPGLTTSAGPGGSLNISGSPSRVGTFILNLKATNGVGAAATAQYVVDVGTAPVIFSTNSKSTKAGRAFTFKIRTRGNPTPALTETGTLPAGTSFVDNGNGTATLAGVPTVTGLYTLSLVATSLNGHFTQTFKIRVN